MSNPWNAGKQQIEQLIRTPGTLMSDLMAHQPLTATVPVNSTIRIFKRCGYIECEKWVVKESDNPCVLSEHHNGDKHIAQIKLTEEEVTEMASSMSSSVSTSISATVSSEISATAGVPNVSSVSAKIGSSITGSRQITAVSSSSIARKIRSLLEIVEPQELSTHVRGKCKKLSVPYGLELVVTIRGTITLSRHWVQNLQNPRTIELSDNLNVESSNLDIQASVDPAMRTMESEVTDTRCDNCGTRDKTGGERGDPPHEEISGGRKQKLAGKPKTKRKAKAK